MTDVRETRSEDAYEFERAAEEGAPLRSTASSLDFVVENALPLTMIGLGVGWLATSMRKHAGRGWSGRAESDPYLVDQPSVGYGYRGASVSSRVAIGVQEGVGELAQRAGDVASEARLRATELSHRAGELAHDARARAGELAHDARARAGELAHDARARAGELSQRAVEQLTHAQRRSVEYADENPLLVGALAVAAGVGVGLLLPATQQENSLLGEVRDRLLDDTRGLIGEARQAARETGRELQRHAIDAKRELSNAVSDPRVAH